MFFNANHFRECPIQIKESISSIIFASTYLPEVIELTNIRKMIVLKFGQKFVDDAIHDNNRTVLPTIRENLTITNQHIFHENLFLPLVRQIALKNGIRLEDEPEKIYPEIPKIESTNITIPTAPYVPPYAPHEYQAEVIKMQEDDDPFLQEIQSRLQSLKTPILYDGIPYNVEDIPIDDGFQWISLKNVPVKEPTSPSPILNSSIKGIQIFQNYLEDDHVDTSEIPASVIDEIADSVAPVTSEPVITDKLQPPVRDEQGFAEFERTKSIENHDQLLDKLIQLHE
jgi:hypothetical protein